MGPGFFIFFQQVTARDSGDTGRDYGGHEQRVTELDEFLRKYELVADQVSEEIFEKTFDTVEGMAKARAESKSSEEMREILGLDQELREPDLAKAYIDYELIQIYRRMRQDEAFLLIILAFVL